MNRFDREREEERDRTLTVLSALISKRLTPALVEALKDPKCLDRFDQELEVMFKRLELLHCS